MNALASRDAARRSRRLTPRYFSLIAALLLIAPPTGAAPPGDYGDAPDDLPAHYPPPDQSVIGRFPTRFNTSNSRYGLPGGHTLSPQLEYLGAGYSIEVDATDPNDPDGAPNLVDNDLDTGVPLETGFLGAICKPTPFEPPFSSAIIVELSFIVTLPFGSPPGTRYLNVLLDMNGDGIWSNEWVAVDYPILLIPGTVGFVTIPAFAYELSPHPMWLRVAFTRAPIVGTFPDDGSGWDGSGAFVHGEIEDHLVQPAMLIYAQDAARAADSASRTALRTAQDADFQIAWATDIDALNLDLQLDLAIAMAVAAGASALEAEAAAAAAHDNAVQSESAKQNAEAFALAVSQACVSCNCATLCASAIAFAQAGAGASSHAWASAEASADAAAAAAAFALAMAQAANAAVVAINLQIDAIAVANADAAAVALASAAAAASAQSAASAAADAQASALLAACSGDAALAYQASANASAQASAAANALAIANANTAAVANAFADAQVDFQLGIDIALAAEASAEAAAFAAAQAQAAANAAAEADASAQASASSIAFGLASVSAACSGDCCPETSSCIPDQLHIDGPGSPLLAGAEGTILATVESNFVPVWTQALRFDVLAGNVSFTNGMVGDGGAETLVQTNSNGDAVVHLIGHAPGQALVRVQAMGTPLVTYALFEVTPTQLKGADASGELGIEGALQSNSVER